MTDSPVRPLQQHAIPRELRELPQWVVWRNEYRDGEPTKVPYRVERPSRRASVSEPSTWGSFEQAVVIVKRGGADGVGFVFSASDPFTGVDLDDCLNDGRLHSAAGEIVDRLSSYTERSPRRCGVHSIIRAELTSKRHRTSATPWGGRFEVYDRGRFFTVTGDHLAGTRQTIEPRPVELDALVAELLSQRRTRSQRPGAHNPLAPLDLSDEEFLARARRAKNGQLFARLFDAGDSSGYDSQSEAELALCGILAFWTRGDADRIDRLFRRSGLFSDKWTDGRGDNPTYGELTIAKAIEGCPAFYTSREDRLRPLLDAVTPEELNEINASGLK